MLAQHLASLDRAVPRYTSYPTAPHFAAAVDAQQYASWLEILPASESLSLYLHVPFCEKLCLYCGCHTKAVRQFAPVEAYAELLIGELNLVAARTGSCRVSHLHWGGGTPSILGPHLLRKLVAELDVHFDLTSLREHAIELDPRSVTKQLAEALADIGVTRASLGVQDLSDRVQSAIGRLQPFSTVERAVGILRDAGIERINIDLMYGLPSQSVEDVCQTVTRSHELKPQRFAMFGYAHVPWFKPHQKLIDESALPAQPMRIAQARAAHEILTGLGYVPIGLDHYADETDSLTNALRVGKLRRNFQGYTTDDADTLIGLGASAIGQLSQGYVQNAKDTGSYARAIKSGRLATVRGIALSADDRMRGRIISELMCNLTCDLDSFAHDADRTFESEIDALLPFVADGLLRIERCRLVVEENGRPYLRLIAAAFDSYLNSSRARHSVGV
ncbi:MAG TPA: oxygen-independent coproporphyrinogen III oxidase [Terriglobales bacterium]|nr:oxygen-independent coproporphyrinogen III oxidase [Terriglobales bacterium]